MHDFTVTWSAISLFGPTISGERTVRASCVETACGIVRSKVKRYRHHSTRVLIRTVTQHFSLAQAHEDAPPCSVGISVLTPRRKTCRNCRYWDRTPDTSSNCTHSALTSGSYLPQDGLRYGGFEGWGDFLLTGPDFGCIHFKSVEVRATSKKEVSCPS